jgi:hypothetical protein
LGFGDGEVKEDGRGSGVDHLDEERNLWKSFGSNSEAD